MHFFGGFGFAAQVEELGAVQAHAVGPAVDAMIDLVGEFDVAQELDADAVAGFGGQIAERLELGRHRLQFFGLVAIAGERFLVGLEDHQALVAVDDHQFAAGDLGQERTGADHGGNFQGLGHDGRVAARPADLGHETADKAAIEVGRFAGREVVGQHQHRRGEVRNSFAAPAQQMPQQSFFDVENVVGPLGQVRTFQLLEDLGVAAQRAADGVLRASSGAGGSSLPVRCAAGRSGAFAGGLRRSPPYCSPNSAATASRCWRYLRGRGGDGLVEPFQFVDHGVARDEPARDAKSLVVHHQRFTYGHARRNGNPL